MVEREPTRRDAVVRLLVQHGMPKADVSIAGTEGEIVVIEVGGTYLEPLRALAPALKGLGFRFVTIDLAAAGPGT